MLSQNVADPETTVAEIENTPNTCFSSYAPDNIKYSQIKRKAFTLNYVSDPVVEYDRNMNIVWANKMACALSNRTLKQLIGNSHCHAFFGCACNCIQCPVESAFEKRQQHTVQMKTQDERAFTITALPFISESGQVDNVIAIIKDQTHSHIIENLLSDEYFKAVAFFAQKLPLLTDREYQVMSLMVQGKSNKIMSQELYVSPKTIEIHRSRVMVKLDVNSLAELVRLFTLFDFYNQQVPFSLLR